MRNCARPTALSPSEAHEKPRASCAEQTQVSRPLRLLRTIDSLAEVSGNHPQRRRIGRRKIGQQLIDRAVDAPRRQGRLERGRERVDRRAPAEWRRRSEYRSVWRSNGYVLTFFARNRNVAFGRTACRMPSS